MKLYGKKIILKSYSLADAPILVKYLNFKDIGQNLEYNWRKINIRKEKIIIKEIKNLVRKKKRFSFVILDKIDKKIIGSCELHKIEIENKFGKLNCWLIPSYRGKGYSNDAISTLINFAFTRLRLNKLNWEVFSFNRRSQRFAEKMGFKKEGIERERHLVKGKFIDRIIYSLLKSEWSKN